MVIGDDQKLFVGLADDNSGPRARYIFLRFPVLLVLLAEVILEEIIIASVSVVFINLRIRDCDDGGYDRCLLYTSYTDTPGATISGLTMLLLV